MLQGSVLEGREKVEGAREDGDLSGRSLGKECRVIMVKIYCMKSLKNILHLKSTSCI